MLKYSQISEFTGVYKGFDPWTPLKIPNFGCENNFFKNVDTFNNIVKKRYFHKMFIMFDIIIGVWSLREGGGFYFFVN